MKTTQPLKWWGGKHYLAKKIIELMPRHLHYVEAYAGGLAVLLERDPHDPAKQWADKSYERGVSEVVNDINRELTNFWRVLQREDTFAVFRRQIEATPFSEIEWKDAEHRQHPITDPDVEAAVAFFIRCRQRRTGGFRAFAPLSRNRTRRRMNEQASAWLTCVDGLPAVSARLRSVVILNRPALEVIRQQDGPKTLFYLDPPYLHETRASTEAYRHEMIEDEHRVLLATIQQCRGKVMLSGYPNPLYDQQLAEWRRKDFHTRLKEMKQTLQLSDFPGHNANAVQWQMWMGLLVHLLLRFLAFLSKWGHRFTRLFAVIRAVLWRYFNLLELLSS